MLCIPSVVGSRGLGFALMDLKVTTLSMSYNAHHAQSGHSLRGSLDTRGNLEMSGCFPSIVTEY